MLIDKLGMTALGARTYCYNVRKHINSISDVVIKKSALQKQSNKVVEEIIVSGDTHIDIEYDQLPDYLKYKIAFKNVCA